MVLSNDNGISVVDDREPGMLHTTTPDDGDVKAQRHQVHELTVPVPITVVRSHLSVYEDDCIDRLLTRVAGKDIIGEWTKGPVSNGIHVLHGNVSDTHWPSLLTIAKLPVSAEQAGNVLVCPDMIPKFDEMTKDVHVVENLSESTQVRLASYKAVLITSPRDLCVTTTMRHLPDGRIAIVTRSVEHPAASHRHGYVRAFAHICGYLLTPDPNDPNTCELSLVANVDLGGKMPAFVVRHLGLSAPIKMVEKMRQVVTTASYN